MTDALPGHADTPGAVPVVLRSEVEPENRGTGDGPRVAVLETMSLMKAALSGR